MLYFTANDVAEKKQIPILLLEHLLMLFWVTCSPRTNSAPNSWQTPRRNCTATLSPNDLWSRNVIISTNVTKLRGRVSLNMTRSCVIWPPTATLALLLMTDTLRDRFVCGLRHDAIQRRLLSGEPSHTKKLWKLHKGWKPPITTPRLSGVQNTLFRSYSWNLSHSRLVTGVIALDIVPALAVSKMLLVMHVERKATSLLPPGPSQDPNPNSSNHQIRVSPLRKKKRERPTRSRLKELIIPVAMTILSSS